MRSSVQPTQNSARPSAPPDSPESVPARRSLSRAGRAHLAAVIAVAAIALFGQLLVQVLLADHRLDGEIINLAGRQRMLSQRMVTFAVTDDREAAHQSLLEWRAGHEQLLSGDLSAFAEASPTGDVAMLAADAATLAREVSALLAAPAGVDPIARRRALSLQTTYLERMDGLVFHFSDHAQHASSMINGLGLGLTLLLLLVLSYEAVFVFRPLVARAQRQIDERERLLAQAQRDARYVRAVRSADLGVWEWELATDALRWSPEFSAVAGWTTDPPPAWSALSARLGDDDAAHLRRALGQVASGRGELRVELPLRLTGGGERWVRLQGRLYEAGFVAGVLVDIDEERRHAAHRQRLLEAQDEQLGLARRGLADAQVTSALHSLASGMAHDFNNLLQVIQASTDLLRHGGLDLEVIDDIERAVAEGSAATTQLLELRPGAADVHRSLSVADLLEETRPVLARAVPPGIAFRLDASELHDVVLMGNGGQIRRALLNLVVNACDAISGRGHITVVGRLRHGGVELAVEDDGAGIPKEHRERILEPFFTTKEGGRGSGLGLAMVHGCALSHGGTLAIESAVGHGTVVRMWMPLTPDEVGGPTSKAAMKAAVGARSEPVDPAAVRDARLILVVDDEARVRLGVQRALVSLGFRVAATAGGREALAWLDSSAEAPVAVVCDVMMPGMLGPEVVNRLRGRLGYPIPVVMVSGNHAADLPVEAPARFLRKPYGIDALGQTLSALLDEPITAAA